MSFHCIQCQRPIDIDSSTELIDSNLTEFTQSLQDRSTQLKASFDTTTIDKLTSALHDSFIVLNGSKVSPTNKTDIQSNATDFNKYIETVTNLNDIVNGVIDLTDINENVTDSIDTTQQSSPLCDKCYIQVKYELDKKFKLIDDDINIYTKYIDLLNNGTTNTQQQQQFHLPHMYTVAERQAIDTELATVQKQEIELLQQLKQMNQEKIDMHAELQKIEIDYSELMQNEYNYVTEYNTVQSELTVKQAELHTIEQQITETTELLNKLKHSNVYNDVFYITFDGTFGTINGQRLGRLATQPVQWAEINAALGDVVLALCVIAKRLNYTFHTYKLHAMGSYTTISLLNDPNNVNELYGSNDISLRKLFRYSRFDTALVWLLHCIDQVQQYMYTQYDHTFEIKYAIVDDKIGNISIKSNNNQDQQWSRACKFLLINLKFMLAWLSKLPDERRS